ncbi:MAG: hypothetical protein PHV37_01790 [Candidatus Gastranaerophilales bacterium]|nr:hypothetical protein [Candidatus Gastranaerophilales bacterium]
MDFIVKTPIRYNHKYFEVGDSISPDEKDTKDLLEAGLIEAKTLVESSGEDNRQPSPPLTSKKVIALVFKGDEDLTDEEKLQIIAAAEDCQEDCTICDETICANHPNNKKAQSGSGTEDGDKAYSELTNKEQIAFFETITDKTELESLIADSKSEAKKKLQKKIKELA